MTHVKRTTWKQYSLIFFCLCHILLALFACFPPLLMSLLKQSRFFLSIANLARIWGSPKYTQKTPQEEISCPIYTFTETEALLKCYPWSSQEENYLKCNVISWKGRATFYITTLNKSRAASHRRITLKPINTNFQYNWEHVSIHMHENSIFHTSGS